MKVLTFIISILAIAQPWLIRLWNKIFKKGIIDIFETGNLEIGFSNWGPTIGVNGTLRCINHDLFVHSMTIEVIKQKDNSTHKFNWAVFRSQKLTYKGEEAEIELPYGFMLITTQPKRYNILFADTETRDEMLIILNSLKNEWIKLASKKSQLIEAQNPSIKDSVNQQYYDEFRKAPVHTETFGKLGQIFYWTAGNYQTTLKAITSRPNRVYNKKWSFNLTDEQVNLIKLNILKILEDTCSVSSFGQYFFAYPKYDSINVKNST